MRSSFAPSRPCPGTWRVAVWGLDVGVGSVGVAGLKGLVDGVRVAMLKECVAHKKQTKRSLVFLFRMAADSVVLVG